METLKVEQMHCEMCVKRIDEALKERGIECEINLAEKTVRIEAGRKKEVLEILDDLGF
ncbi:MAG: heavy-metal-associated domain-containing protein [Clostridia bacterium]|nr:heavy-metal-associated domain-containing protein [Clostridia bacterium]